MDIDDIIYVLLLISSIGFGHFFRQISNRRVRQKVSTALGVLIVLFTSGTHILHPLICFLGNWIILEIFNKKVIHIVSFSFSFLYLLFFRTSEYFGIPYAPSHTNLIQMILTLKLVGVAFEVHDSVVEKYGQSNPEIESSRVAKPSFIELFHYAFSYIGVLTGPYYSYRAYWDLFHSPFGDVAQCWKAVLQRSKYVPFWALCFLISSSYFPHSYLDTDEYRNECNLAYRLWYIIPCFFTFRMRMYIGMRLSECVVIMSGLGAYPAITDPKPGHGPTTNHSILIVTAADPARLINTQYNFDTVYNIEPRITEFDYTVRSSMKSWNMTVQYWLAAYVYRRFPYKNYRLYATFLISSFWHGMYLGHYMCLCSVPFYLPIEDIYIKHLSRITFSPLVMKLGFLVCYTWRMLLMGYWGMPFLLLDLVPSLRFWFSVYFLPTLISIAMYSASHVLFPKTHVEVPVVYRCKEDKDNKCILEKVIRNYKKKEVQIHNCNESHYRGY